MDDDSASCVLDGGKGDRGVYKRMRYVRHDGFLLVNDLRVG